MLFLETEMTRKRRVRFPVLFVVNETAATLRYIELGLLLKKRVYTGPLQYVKREFFNGE